MPRKSWDYLWVNFQHVLNILKDGSKHRSEWTLAARAPYLSTQVKGELKKGLTTHQFNYILKFALAEGYVIKIGRGKYKLTEKGAHVLKQKNAKMPDHLATTIALHRLLKRQASQNSF